MSLEIAPHRIPTQTATAPGCQVCRRFAVLQEFLHTDRREGCHDRGVSPLSRKFVGGAVLVGDESATRRSELKELAWLLPFDERDVERSSFDSRATDGISAADGRMATFDTSLVFGSSRTNRSAYPPCAYSYSNV